MDDHTASLNPWELQRELMKASRQRLPDVPTLSKNSVMYAALMLEELGETLRDGLLPALWRCLEGELPTETMRARLHSIFAMLNDQAEAMRYTADIVRENLKDIPDFDIGMNLHEAKGALDGTTDLAVVNCGFALASGLPGAEGYAEVACSNLSKRNPETGVIDCTADGKWIKGRNFKLPDLENVLLAKGMAFL